MSSTLLPPVVPSAVSVSSLQALCPNASLKQAWQALCQHYATALPTHLLDDDFEDELTHTQQLITTAEQLGLEVTPLVLAPQALLQQAFPLLVAPTAGEAYWLVGKRGLTVLVRQNNTTTELPLDTLAKHCDDGLLEAYTFKTSGHKASSNRQPLLTVRWFLGQFISNGLMTAQLLMASLLVQVFALGMPLLYMVIFDRVFGRQNLATLDVIAVGVAVLLLFDVGVKQVRGFVFSHLLKQLDKQVVEDFLDRLFSLNLKTAQNERMRGFADLFAAISTATQALATLCLITSLDVTFSLLVAMVLFVLDTNLALIALAPVLPMALVSLWYIPHIKQRQMAFELEQRSYRLRLSEAIDDTETLKSLDAEQATKASLKETFRQHVLAESHTPHNDRTKLLNAQTFIAAAGALVLLYVGASRVLDGHLSFGVYLAVNMLSRTITGNVQKLFDTLAQVQESFVKLNTLKGLYHAIQAENSPKDGVVLDTVAGDIDVVDVSFKYDEHLPLVLNKVNFRIKAGQKVVLTGRSGSGKSTLLRLLQHLYTPTQGYMMLDGYKLSDLDLSCLRQHIGVAIQKPALFMGTLRSNIAVGNPTAPLRSIIQAATMAQLDHFIVSHPLGLEMPVLHKGANLSGGQAARVALARLFLRKPSVLCLDEAVNALEPNLKSAVFTQVWQQYAKQTCLFVTDVIPVHQKADLILVLHEGQILEQGTFKQLMSQRGYYYHLHKHQLPTLAPVAAANGQAVPATKATPPIKVASPQGGV